MIFDSIDEEVIKQAASRRKSGSGPSGLDAILALNHYGTVTSDLRKAFAEMIKKLCIEKVDERNGNSSIEAWLAVG